MRLTTSVFLTSGDRVLLAMKKRGFGAGKWNGVGGKVQAGENILDAARREAKEEIGVEVGFSGLRQQAVLNFEFKSPMKSDWNQSCHVFVADVWRGKPKESEEMRPEWFPVETLPFEQMWADDPVWLPLVLAGGII
ncbi:8-oxo-dGTP diphosphatase [Patescibacteria group bacterium]|nr:8-oxo-dGTP diphosphatase [Patescibacteria group bacterium]